MKTIAELQQDIRLIKKDIDGIDKRLDAMSSELSYYKSATTEDSEYKRIYEIAKTMPIIAHPVAKESRAVKNNYLGTLLMITTVVDSLNEKQLLFLQRIIMSDEEANQLDVYIGSLGTITPENVLFQMEDTVKNEFAYQLLLDAIILVNLSNSATRDNFELIANIAAFLEIKKNELKNISQVALALLKQTATVLLESESVINLDRKYGFYLCELPGWNERAKKDYIEKLVNLIGEHIAGDTRKEIEENKNSLRSSRVSIEMYEKGEAFRTAAQYWIDGCRNWSNKEMEEISFFLDAYEDYVEKIKLLDKKLYEEHEEMQSLLALTWLEKSGFK